MDDLRVVPRSDGRDHRQGAVERFGHREPLAGLEHRRQVAPLEQLHGDVGASVLVAERQHLHDVRMPDPRDSPPFEQEPLGGARTGRDVWVQSLEGHEAPEPRIHRLVHRAHRAAADARDDTIRAAVKGCL